MKSVAFGEDWDSYFVVFTDGWWGYSDVPQSLTDTIQKRDKRADLDFVSLGPSGEWFLSAKNGRMWWIGPYQLDSDQEAFKENTESLAGRIKRIHFGLNGSYVIRYT